MPFKLFLNTEDDVFTHFVCLLSRSRGRRFAVESAIRHRLQIDMSDKALAQLKEIQVATDAQTRAEVIRNALRVYAWLVLQRKEGFDISLLKRRDDQEIEVILPEVGL